MAVQTQLSATSQALLFIMVGLTLDVSNGLQYKVGGSIWSIPPYPTYYSNWSSSHRFFVGDVLLFEFRTGFYNVMQVSRREYEACTADNPFRSFRTGPARVPLIEKGVFYFICSVSCYCSLGQKVEVAAYHHPVPVVVPPPDIVPPPTGPTTVTDTVVPSCSPKQLLGKGMGPSHELFIQALQHQLVLLLCLLVTLLLVVDHDFVGCELRS
ncbi:cucumber peeling cupredoxin-like [Syzygium oleosum]|uniref:cucumber peeling cupredoxin-like n=1 Tax=Syzygium oleosum TaxID=219896 RepID=UPI0011D1CF0A|nr:cucumber peeling cupredoxin-like [Syzygium oleosum]